VVVEGRFAVRLGLDCVLRQTLATDPGSLHPTLREMPRRMGHPSFVGKLTIVSGTDAPVSPLAAFLFVPSFLTYVGWWA
jgi:hypothetical protein